VIKRLWFILLVFPFAMEAQVITTVSGTSGGSIYDPQQLAFDRYGNLYIPTGLGNQIMKLDTQGVISVFAGIGGSGGYGGDNGLATAAQFNGTLAVVVDTFDNIYLTDAGNNRIRKINFSTGIITTVFGIGTPGFSGDGGPASSAKLFSPKGLFLDKHGNFYFTDASNYRVRKINPLGIITTIAGNGILNSTGDGGPATSAAIGVGYSLCTDVLGNLFVIDQYANTIRKVDNTGKISTIAGDATGSYTYTGDGVPALGAGIAPASITFDEFGELTISDNGNYRVRKIDNSGIIRTIAGSGTYGYSGDGGPAGSAEIASPSGIAYDHCGNLYIAQVNNPCIRKVAFNPACWPAEVPKIATTDVVIYPNPFESELNVDNLQTNEQYIIMNITGIIEQQGNLKAGNNTISIPSLPPGLYLLEVMDEEGERTVRKIVKE
jgi:hypothetical protein